MSLKLKYQTGRAASFRAPFDDYEIYVFPCRPKERSGTAILFRKRLGLEISAIFVGKLVVLDVNSSEGGSLRLVVVYAPTGVGQLDYFRRLETFLASSRNLVLGG